jgi:hypothetical protein
MKDISHAVADFTSMGLQHQNVGAIGFFLIWICVLMTNKFKPAVAFVFVHGCARTLACM